MKELLITDSEAMRKIGELYPADARWIADERVNSTVNICNQNGPAYRPFCTLTKGHSGAHIAHLADNKAFAVWFDEEGTEEEAKFEMLIKLLGGHVAYC